VDLNRFVPREAATKEKLTKVVSTKISEEDYSFLKRKAKILYNDEKLDQPNTSQLLRLIIKNWVENTRKNETTENVEDEEELEFVSS
jgi:hypothetical protein